MRRETFAASGPLKLDLSVPAGEIAVEALETEEVIVELEPLRDAEEAVEDARVELRGDELVVEVRDRRGWSAEIRLRVVAPSGSKLSARAGSADIRTRGRLGRAEINAASGDVTIDEVGSLNASVASGDLEAAKVAGDAKIESASGDVEVAHLEGNGAISTASGDVHLGEALGDLRIRTASGDQRIGALREGHVELASASGDVHVGIRPGSLLQVDARSSSGDVTSELEVGDAPVDDQGPLVRLQVTAMSGDVEIVRA
jgi:DUF4097 and DUF4098 domain-containing protein YvlB